VVGAEAGADPGTVRSTVVYWSCNYAEEDEFLGLLHFWVSFWCCVTSQSWRWCVGVSVPWNSFSGPGGTAQR